MTSQSHAPCSQLWPLRQDFVQSDLRCIFDEDQSCRCLGGEVEATSPNRPYSQNFWHWMKNCLEQWVERVLRFFERYIHENSRARKREATIVQYNTAKLTKPRPKMAASVHGDTVRQNIVNVKNACVLSPISQPDISVRTLSSTSSRTPVCCP